VYILRASQNEIFVSKLVCHVGLHNTSVESIDKYLSNYNKNQQQFTNNNNQIQSNVQHNKEKLNKKEVYTDGIPSRVRVEVIRVQLRQETSSVCI
jgi:hypothetical protein